MNYTIQRGMETPLFWDASDPCLLRGGHFALHQLLAVDCGHSLGKRRSGAGDFIPDPLSGGIHPVPGFLNPVSGVSPILLVENRDKHCREEGKTTHTSPLTP